MSELEKNLVFRSGLGWITVVTLMAADHAGGCGDDDPNDRPVPMTGYGSRTVSVDLVRGRTLVPVDEGANASTFRSSRPISAMTCAQVSDRLSLSHWPRGHQIFICSLAGGVGRTTVAGLLGLVLANQPFRHIRPPVALVERSPRGLSRTSTRWTPARNALQQARIGQTTSGLPDILAVVDNANRANYSCVIVEAPAGLPSDDDAIVEDPSSSLVIVTPPDKESLDALSEALIWMAKLAYISRDRVTVVVNWGSRPYTRPDRASIAALGIRCSSVHRLSYAPDLDVGRRLPPPDHMRRKLRRRMERIALAIWTAQDLKQSLTSKEQS